MDLLGLWCLAVGWPWRAVEGAGVLGEQAEYWVLPREDRWDCSLYLFSPQNEAVEMMDQIIHWVRVDPTGLGRPQLSGTPATEPMAVPMMLLSLVEQLGEEDEALTSKYAELGDWCAHRILQHVQVGTERVAE